MESPDDTSVSLPVKSQSTYQTDRATSTTHINDQTSNTIPDFTPSKEAKDLILGFLATSSSKSLGCAFVALIFATYIILGRVGLLLIGLVLGVLLHASWEGESDKTRPGAFGSRSPRKRKELVNRLLDWPKRIQTQGNHEGGQQRTIEAGLRADLNYSTFGPGISTALRSITDAVIRDYVIYWYGPILPSETTFPLSCRITLTDFITSVASHLQNKRPADTFLQFLINASSVFIVFLNELSTAFQVAGTTVSPQQAIARYLELYPDSSLANIIAIDQQHTKLNMVADDILSGFLDQKSYSCAPVRDFLREILAGVVFESTISSLSRPEFINTWIIYFFSEGESEIMNAIDAGVEGARNQGVTVPKRSNDIQNPDLDCMSSARACSRPPSRLIEQQSNDPDKATHEAVMETKRLSDMIAVQDAQRKDIGQGTHIRTGAGASPRERSAVDISSPIVNAAQGSGDQQEEGSKSDNTKPYRDTYGLRGIDPVSPTQLIEKPSLPLNSILPSGQINDAPLTLHGAYISVDYDSPFSEQGTIKSKPTFDYLLQIEPVVSRCTGWMVFRKYADFESLHETLGTISRLNKIQVFIDQHPLLPPWKGQTNKALAQNLERYLQDALQHESLAESGKMKRFLEKDTRLGHQPVNTTKSGSLLPNQTSFENMGRGFLDALANAPKGFAGGSKAVIGGVTGAFGNVTASNKRTSSSFQVENAQSTQCQSNFTLDQSGHLRNPGISSKLDIDCSPLGGMKDPSAISSHCDGWPTRYHEESNDVLRKSANESTNQSFEVGKQSMQDATRSKSDIGSPKSLYSSAKENGEDPGSQASYDEPPEPHSFQSSPGLNATKKSNHSITDEETQMAIELIFAVINELYSISSAWNIRKTLLSAAKSYILRPGNPNLETIRTLLQDSMIDAHTTDQALAQYLESLRESALPTEDELESWPPSPSDVEKERLRVTARKVFVQRGIPQALMSVMGAAASREALEKIFDCLQVEAVARGLAFSVLMQVLRAVIL